MALPAQSLLDRLQTERPNPLEAARLYRRLMEEYGLTQAAIALALGKKRSTISNTLRLLHLPPAIRQMIVEGKLSEGHARALSGLRDSPKLETIARQVVVENWPVRKVEQRVRQELGRENPVSETQKAFAATVERDLSAALGTKVEIHDENGRGTIVLHYFSLDEFDRLYEMLKDRK